MKRERPDLGAKGAARAAGVPLRSGGFSSALTLAAYGTRESFRHWLRAVFPRRHVRVIVAHTSAALEAAFRRELIDAACIDLDRAGDDTWRAARLAEEFPSAAFFAVASYRGTEAPAIARCVGHGFADVLAGGVDDVPARELVVRHAFSTRFARALAMPPAPLHLVSDLQRRTWAALVSRGGRPVHTAELAHALGFTREHLSRRFAGRGGPNLKRVIDLVRLLAAAELAKNPGYETGDVATVLGFASASHLSTAVMRITGARPASLARLRAVDLVRRFVAGRGRSRQ